MTGCANNFLNPGLDPAQVVVEDSGASVLPRFAVNVSAGEEGEVIPPQYSRVDVEGLVTSCLSLGGPVTSCLVSKGS